jgi:hypothetical protein
MSEKRGQTEKLKYDFNTAQAVFIKRNDKMYRVTERDFRSHSGDRYIYVKQSTGIYEYVKYSGPVYYYNTNKICVEIVGENLLQYIHNQPRVSVARPSERKIAKTLNL